MMRYLGVKFDPLGALDGMIAPHTQDALGAKLNQHVSILPLRSDLLQHVNTPGAPAMRNDPAPLAWRNLLASVHRPSPDAQPGQSFSMIKQVINASTVLPR